MKPDADTYDGRLDAYLAWLFWCAWRAARGDRTEADRLFSEWRRQHGL